MWHYNTRGQGLRSSTGLYSRSPKRRWRPASQSATSLSCSIPLRYRLCWQRRFGSRHRVRIHASGLTGIAGWPPEADRRSSKNEPYNLRLSIYNIAQVKRETRDARPNWLTLGRKIPCMCCTATQARGRSTPSCRWRAATQGAHRARFDEVLYVLGIPVVAVAAFGDVGPTPTSGRRMRMGHFVSLAPR
jgi:hypothetical protein